MAVLDMPGLLADHLPDTQDAAIREALHSGRTMRRGQGYSARVTAPLAFHQAALRQCAALANRRRRPARAQGVPRLRRPRRSSSGGQPHSTRPHQHVISSPRRGGGEVSDEHPDIGGLLLLGEMPCIGHYRRSQVLDPGIADALLRASWLKARTGRIPQ